MKRTVALKRLGVVFVFVMFGGVVSAQNIESGPAPGLGISREQFSRQYLDAPEQALRKLSPKQQIDLYLWMYAGSDILGGYGSSNWSDWGAKIAKRGGQAVVDSVLEKLKTIDVVRYSVHSEDEVALLIMGILLNLSDSNVTLSNDQTISLVGTLEQKSVQYLMAHHRISEWIQVGEKVIEHYLGITRPKKGDWIPPAMYYEAAYQKYVAMGIIGIQKK